MLYHAALQQLQAECSTALRGVLPSPLVFIDLETTSDRYGHHHIVDICLIRLEEGEYPRMWSSLIDPGPGRMHIRPRAWHTAPHRIEPSDLDDAPYFHTVLPYVTAMCWNATIVAHNAHFERRVLSKHYRQLGCSWDHPHLCTLRLACRLEQGRARNGRPRGTPGTGYRLTDLARDFGVYNPAPHRAIGDAGTLQVVLTMLLLRHRHRRDLHELVANSVI